VTLAEARSRAREILELARRGENPVEELRHRAEEERAEAVRRAGLTVLAVVERHLDARRATLRPATLSQYQFTMKALRQSPLAARQLHELKRGEVREALHAFSGERGSGSARKVKTFVRAAARGAAAEDLLPHDVLAGLSMPGDRAPGGGSERFRTRKSPRSGARAMTRAHHGGLGPAAAPAGAPSSLRDRRKCLSQKGSGMWLLGVDPVHHVNWPITLATVVYKASVHFSAAAVGAGLAARSGRFHRQAE
jgi:hypothetical protein